MVKCVNCDAVNTLIGARFCVHCGARLPEATEPAPRAAAVRAADKPASAGPAETTKVPVSQPAPRTLGIVNPPVDVRITPREPANGPTAYSYVAQRQAATPSREATQPTAASAAPPIAERPTLASASPFASGASQVAPNEPTRHRGSAPPPSSMSEALSRASDGAQPATAPQADAPATARASAQQAVADKTVDAPGAPAPKSKRGIAPSSVWEVADKKVAASEPGPAAPVSAQRPATSPAVAAPHGPPAPAAEPMPSTTEKPRQAAPQPSSEVPGSRPASTPPASKPKGVVGREPEGEPPFGDDSLRSEVDALLLDIDAGFDRIVEKPETAPSAGHSELTEEQTHEVRGLFTQIAAGHMRPVRDFVIELKLGEPQREWIDLIRPAVGSLRKSAEGMGLTDLCKATDEFLAALDLAAEDPSPRIRGEARELLTTAYDDLGKVMPEAFELDEEQDRREPVIVQSLLRQVPDVRKVAMDKLYAAGLTRLEMYYVAKAYDVAQAAGLPEALAEKIVRRFAQYKQEASFAAPDLERSHEHKKLAVLSTKLAQQNEAFMLASRSLSAQAARDKRCLRQERNQTVLEINVLLARIGEVQLVEELEKLPFQGKIEAVRAWLEMAKARAAAAGTTGG